MYVCLTAGPRNEGPTDSLSEPSHYVGHVSVFLNERLKVSTKESPMIQTADFMEISVQIVENRNIQ